MKSRPRVISWEGVSIAAPYKRVFEMASPDATADTYRSALRGVMRECWGLGYLLDRLHVQDPGKLLVFQRAAGCCAAAPSAAVS